MKDVMDEALPVANLNPAMGGPLEPMAGILSLMSDLVALTDNDGFITWVNSAFERRSGYALDEAIGRHISDITIGHASDRTTFADVSRAFAKREACSGETTYASKNGIMYRVSFDLKPMQNEMGVPTGFLFMHRDITNQRELESSLRSERYFLTRMIDTGVSAVAAFDSVGRCVFANSEARDILDSLTRAERLCAASWPLRRITAEPLELDGEGSKADDEFEDEPEELPFARVMRTGKPLHGMVIELLVPGTARRVFSVNAAPLRDSETAASVVMALTDITARFEAEAARRRTAIQAQFDARHDDLTGLPNGRYFNSALAKAVAPLTVILIDIDNFRSIRSVLGRRTGDALLCAFGERLAQVLNARGFLARSEGNAFSVRLDSATPQAVEDLAQEFRNALQHAFILEEITVYATASMGISYHAAGSVGEAGANNSLLRQAEIANFAAKTAGGNRLAYYNTAMDTRLSRRNVIVQALRRALQENQFELAFQPKFAMPSVLGAHGVPLQLIGSEALLRWNAPDLGRVSPEEFIPIAEAAGVISDIDFHVMGIFARQLGRWRAAGLHAPASINLSPRSFEDCTLAPRLLELLDGEGVAAETVTVEITETSLISMSEAALANINQLRQAGVHLSIDDFGTGYSSFSYLQKLIVSEIKIDRSFIHLLTADDNGEDTENYHGTRMIVRSILALARTLGIRAIAEGVENAEQLAWLQQEGCHSIQGFLGGRAVSADTFERTYLHRPNEAKPAP
ncbi:EAL domain-containing protein [Pseudorhodobacter sp. W20_MBD10_FR17]|uniref:sensor domain-containing protein n=1 Tax=Pseudorhodobacter sp. W20_MBD10_FR17 TaxID=3240266 RepID=UPI003F972DA2